MTHASTAGPSPVGKIVTFVSLATAILGPLLAFGTGERRIAEQSLRNDEVDAQVRAADGLLARRPAIESERDRLRAGAPVDSPANAARALARFLADAGHCADAHGTRLAALTANRTQTARASFDLSLEGRYIDVLATIRELSGLRVPASVEVASIVRTAPDAPEPRLAAVLHVVLDPLSTARGSVASARQE